MTRTVAFASLMLVLTCSVSCSLSDSGSTRFAAVWDAATPASLAIIRTVGNDSRSFAVFAKLSKADFEAFRKGTSRYTAWNRIEDGMTFEIGTIELRAPSDIRGVYAVGEKADGAVKVVVWDESSETVVAMVCSGII